MGASQIQEAPPRGATLRPVASPMPCRIMAVMRWPEGLLLTFCTHAAALSDGRSTLFPRCIPDAVQGKTLERWPECADTLREFLQTKPGARPVWQVRN